MQHFVYEKEGRLATTISVPDKGKVLINTQENSPFWVDKEYARSYARQLLAKGWQRIK